MNIQIYLNQHFRIKKMFDGRVFLHSHKVVYLENKKNGNKMEVNHEIHRFFTETKNYLITFYQFISMADLLVSNNFLTRK